MASSSSILPVVESDLPLLGELLFQSKLQLTINRLLWNDWPNEAAQRPQYERAVRAGFNDDSVENLKVVDDVAGEIVGFLGLSRKRPATVKETTQQGPADHGNVPAHFNTDVLAAVVSATSKCAEGWDAIDHYELTYIYVKPSHRRRGIASQLVQHCFHRAKTAGIPLVVSSEPAAIDFFVSLDFKETTYYDIDLARWAPAYTGFGPFRLAAMTWFP